MEKNLQNLKFNPYYVRKNSLTVVNGCLTFGMKMIIPKSLKQIILKKLH